jgi:hypothetical protein
MLPKFNQDERRAYEQRLAGLSDNDLSAELSRCHAEGANLTAARERLEATLQAVAVVDLSTVEGALEATKEPAADTTSFERLRILAGHVAARRGLVQEELRQRSGRKALAEVAAHLIANEQLLRQAVAFVEAHKKVAGKVAQPHMLPPIFSEYEVTKALEYARQFVPNGKG